MDSELAASRQQNLSVRPEFCPSYKSSDIRLVLRQRDQIRPIFYTANPVGMKN
jgi:hypothetical protein